MTLAVLLARLSQADLLHAGSGKDVRADGIEITRVTSDSRAVKPDSLFVAVAGEKADGHRYVDKAIQLGAVAIVSEREVEADVPAICVSNSRAALAHASALLAGDPAQRLAMIGVTGTNGKTTTAYLLHQMTEALGHKAGLIGTIETRIGDEVVASTHTTPGPEALHKLLARMEAAGCSHCVMEVSSHALDQDRVAAVPFAAAAFTNLTRDHLDYHGSMDAYRAAKRRLFEGLSEGLVAAINIDDPSGADMADAARAKGATVIGYGESEAPMCASAWTTTR